jgi:hypothetical protein
MGGDDLIRVIRDILAFSPYDPPSPTRRETNWGTDPADNAFPRERESCSMISTGRGAIDATRT